MYGIKCVQSSTANWGLFKIDEKNKKNNPSVWGLKLKFQASEVLIWVVGDTKGKRVQSVWELRDGQEEDGTSGMQRSIDKLLKERACGTETKRNEKENRIFLLLEREQEAAKANTRIGRSVLASLDRHYLNLLKNDSGCDPMASIQTSSYVLPWRFWSHQSEDGDRRSCIRMHCSN